LTHNELKPLADPTHRETIARDALSDGAPAAAGNRQEALPPSTVVVVLDRKNLPVVSPIKVGLFSDLKLLDTSKINDKSCRLSTPRSGSFLVAVDTTTTPAVGGFVDSEWSVQRVWGQWRPFAEVNIGPGEEETIPLRFIPPGSLAVTVLDPEGRPLEGAILNLRSVDVADEHQVLESDLVGACVFKGLRAGGYVLMARHANLNRHAYRVTRLQVEPGKDSITRIQPEVANSSISGRLADLSGRPLGGAALALTFEESSARRAVTQSDGSFLFEGLLAGEVTIAVLNQELPLRPEEPAMDIVSAPIAEQLLLLPNEKIDLPELTVELEERPTLAIHVFAPDGITKEQIVVKQIVPRGHRASFPTADVFRAGTSLIRTVRVRRPRKGAERLVTLWQKNRCLASTLIKADSPLTTTVYLE
jgi:hypothetical protein